MCPARLLQTSTSDQPLLKHKRLIGNDAIANGVRLNWNGKSAGELYSDFVLDLGSDDIDELERAMATFQATRLPLHSLTSSKFPLPTLGKRIKKWTTQLYSGIGFFIIRGLKPSKYTGPENIVMFVGISSYVGDKRAKQYEEGPTLTHVIDLGPEEVAAGRNEIDIPDANRNVAIPFHTDHGHILSLYCLHSAAVGGESLLASVKTIVDSMRSLRPDLVEELKKEWLWDTLDPEKPSVRRPLLFEETGETIMNYSRRYFLGTPKIARNPALGDISAVQREALDVLQSIAEEVAWKRSLDTGDIQYVNNLAVLHARESFNYCEGDGCRRHLMRMFLKDSYRAWNIPPALEPIMKTLYEHSLEEESFPWEISSMPYIASP